MFKRLVSTLVFACATVTSNAQTMLAPATTSYSQYVVLVDTSLAPKTGISPTDMTISYTRERAAPVTATATALVAVTSAYTSGAAIEIDATNCPGLYRVDWPNAAFASGVGQVALTVKAAGILTHTDVVLLSVGLRAVAVNNASGSAVWLESSGSDGRGLYLLGHGTGEGLGIMGGSSGIGATIQGQGNSNGLDIGAAGTEPAMIVQQTGGGNVSAAKFVAAGTGDDIDADQAFSIADLLGTSLSSYTTAGTVGKSIGYLSWPVNVTVTSPVASSGTITITQGDSYDDSSLYVSRTWTGTDLTTPTTCTFKAIPTSNYNSGATATATSVSCTLTADGTTYTITIPLTSTLTAAMTGTPGSMANYTYSIVVVKGGKTYTLFQGALLCKKKVS